LAAKQGAFLADGLASARAAGFVAHRVKPVELATFSRVLAQMQ
jgi:hypothetical protein